MTSRGPLEGGGGHDFPRSTCSAARVEEACPRLPQVPPAGEARHGHQLRRDRGHRLSVRTVGLDTLALATVAVMPGVPHGRTPTARAR